MIWIDHANGVRYDMTLEDVETLADIAAGYDVNEGHEYAPGNPRIPLRVIENVGAR